MYEQTIYPSPVGVITLLCDREGGHLTGLGLRGGAYSEAFARTAAKENSVLSLAKLWLDRYFAGEKPDISELPLAPAGSAFRQEVWSLLREIPYGQTVTYGEIAKEIAARHGLEKMSAQAVGGAVGHNPIPIIIPCHRVVGSGGSLTGYAGGIEMKRRLLELEGINMSLFRVSSGKSAKD